MSDLWKDCGNVQCAQVHAVLDSLLQWLEVECPDSIYTVGKSLRIVDAINKLKDQKQWRTDALKDAHDDKAKMRGEIFDLKHNISLRAWLAGMAMNGMASVTEYDFSDPNVTEAFAKQSVSMADALIAELEKQP